MTFIEDLKSLVECESPSEDVAACRKVIDVANSVATRVLGVAGSILEINNRPVFWWGSKDPEVILLAHLDTVWPIGSFSPLWSIEGDLIRGPGTFDMKAGFLQALYSLIDLPGAAEKVALVATTDEELGSQTSRDFIKEIASKAKAVLVLEASLDGKVKTGRKGTAMYQIQVTGKAAHAGLEPEKGINASVEIAHIVLAMADLENSVHGTTVVPTVLQAGTTTNTVPSFATLDIDIRSFSNGELERVDQAIQQLQPHNPAATIEVRGGINRPPLEVSATQNLYEKLEAVAGDIGMKPIGHASVGGASDGNFAAATGTPTLDGLGAVGAGAHASHEHVVLSSIQDRITLLSAFIKELIRE